MENSSDTFNTLWDKMHGPLCGFVCSRLSNPQDAEDILQDVFLRIYHSVDTVRDPQRLESWAYQVARNRIIDHYRGRRQWEDLPETLPVSEEPEQEAAAGLLPAVRKIVHSLPDTDRDALVLADFQGMTQHDLAAQFGVSLSGAKSRVQRARKKVKAALLNCFDLEFDAQGSLMNYSPHCCC